MVGGVLLSYQVFSLIDSTAASSGTTEVVGNNSTNGTAKTYINVAVDIDQNMLNKNVSITNGQNGTNIIVTEVNPGS